MESSERNISLIGKSGREYYGKIYSDRGDKTSLSGPAIVCLSNTRWTDNHWQHSIKEIYDDTATNALDHFRERDDISHIILIPRGGTDTGNSDPIDDLRRQYIHR